MRRQAIGTKNAFLLLNVCNVRYGCPIEGLSESDTIPEKSGLPAAVPRAGGRETEVVPQPECDLTMTEFIRRINENDPLKTGPIKARFAIIAFFVLMSVVFLPILKLQSLLLPILAACSIGIVSNFISLVWIAWGRGLQYRIFFASFVDVLLITIALHYLGGIEESFAWVYAVALIVIASRHGLKVGIYAATVSSLLYSGLLLAEFSGLIRHVDYGIVNPVYIHEDPFYLRIKILSGIILFFLSAVVSGVLSERLLRSKSELEKTVTERTKELTVSNEQLRQEISDRKLAENSLRASERKYRTLLDSIGVGFYETDLEGYMIFFNETLCKLLGYTENDLKGLHYRQFIDEKDRKTVFHVYNTVYRTGQSATGFVYNIISKDGRRIPHEASVTLVRDDAGRPIGFRGIARDVTEEKQLEERLLQAQKMESIGTLAGGIAHDFNNLLAGILGYASLTKTKISREHDIFRYIEAIEASASRAADLTSQLLAFARGGKYESKPVNLNTVVEDTLKILSRTLDKSIEITRNLREHLPNVEADPAQMQQLLMNLCVNAGDAMPNGGHLTIGTDVVEMGKNDVDMEAAPGPYVMLSVADTGVGMDRETIARIFEPFFTTKGPGEGTGLGLSMVYGVVKNHGGAVTVQSKPGAGSTFKIYLPASTVPDIYDGPDTKMLQNGDELILVVDDEDSVRSMAQDMLEPHGYSVLVAEDGEQALDIYKRHSGNIKLVILDMVMPRMGGRETFQQLQRLNPEVRVLLSTGYSREGKAQEILDSGVMGFIQKPYRANTLLSSVRNILDTEALR